MRFCVTGSVVPEELRRMISTLIATEISFNSTNVMRSDGSLSSKPSVDAVDAAFTRVLCFFCK